MLVELKQLNKKEVNVVTSLDVAETFEKLHKDVLESIRNIQDELSTAEFSALFYESEYKASNGKSNPMYYMNRDGFTFLVMGYTGEKAMRFKLAYIKQFNAIRRRRYGRFNLKICCSDRGNGKKNYEKVFFFDGADRGNKTLLKQGKEKRENDV